MGIYCSDIQPLVQTYLDGELADGDGRDFDGHIAHCASCRDRVTREHHFGHTVRSRLAPVGSPEALRGQVLATLDGEDREHARAIRRARVSWALPGAASVAAVAALAVFTVDAWMPANDADAPIAHEAASNIITRSPAVVPGTRTEISRSLHDYFRVPVQPPRFSRAGVVLRGWRPSLLQGREAAGLEYEVASRASGRHRVWVHILEAANLDLASKDRREVSERTIWVDRPLGFSSVTYRDSHGMGYVFTSEMPEEELVELVVDSDILHRVNERLRGR